MNRRISKIIISLFMALTVVFFSLTCFESSVYAKTKAKSKTTTKVPFYAAGDENYLRVAYLANWGSYEIGVTDEWGGGDPAVGFTRANYSDNPFYIEAMNEFLADVGGSKEYDCITINCIRRIDSEDDFLFYENILKNLEVDLMKSGWISNVEFGLVPADGNIHLESLGIDYAVCATYNASCLEADDIAEHPEIKGYITKGCMRQR